MREILFRGKREDTGEWVEGFYTELYPSCVYSVIENHDVAYIVIPESVGQYTGLTDKNGAKIFEGDILLIKNPNCYDSYCTVDFSGKDSAFVVKEGTEFEEYLSYIVTYDDNDVEVVGNIYDNPELIP